MEKKDKKTMEEEQNISEDFLTPESEKKEQEAREKVSAIQPSVPVLIENEKDLDEVLKKHTLWMKSILGDEELGEGVRANIKGANLAGFTLEACNLSCANLEGVSFIGAKLVDVNFTGASLQKAFLQGAVLKNCNFHHSRLLEADFTESDIADCFFSEEQKKDAIGLF